MERIKIQLQNQLLTVAGRSVDYHYGENKNTTPEPVTPSYTAYQVGDHVSYNGVSYYVIENSDATNDTVKLLKEEPLTKTEMDNLHLTGITITESNSYGQVQYGSTNDYSTSTVKQVVDAWKNSAVKSDDTATARLITLDELVDNFGYTLNSAATGYNYSAEYTPSWVYNSIYYYWTMTPKTDSSFVWFVFGGGYLNLDDPSLSYMVRPVLELSKSADLTMVS